jgi:hypothetical protein
MRAANRANEDKLTSQAFGAPRTPTSGSEDEGPPPHYTHDDDEGPEDLGAPAEAIPRRKPGGYDSRIEQILYENPDMPIVITDAGKSLESGGRYIVYTIRTGVCWKSFTPYRWKLC